MMMRMAPVMRVLDMDMDLNEDEDEDGEISAEEIAAVPAQLATLDADKNGILEGGELPPRFPGRGGRGRREGGSSAAAAHSASEGESDTEGEDGGAKARYVRVEHSHKPV